MGLQTPPVLSLVPRPIARGGGGGGGGRVWEHRYTKVVLEERNLWLVGRANTSRAS